MSSIIFPVQYSVGMQVGMLNSIGSTLFYSEVLFQLFNQCVMQNFRSLRRRFRCRSAIAVVSLFFVTCGVIYFISVGHRDGLSEEELTNHHLPKCSDTVKYISYSLRQNGNFLRRSRLRYSPHYLTLL